jgi:adenosylcobinamide-GDP ribazoletransferase
VRSLTYAIRTLTRLPIGTGTLEREEQSLFWFPLVGAFYGVVAHLISRLALPSSLLAALIVAAWAYLSRAFHLDGLADWADGLGGGWSAERTLAIMRDSHIGAFGVITLIITLLVQYASLSNLVDDPLALLLSPLFGRAMIVVTASLLPYARQGEGSASQLVRGATGRHCVVLIFQLIFVGIICWLVAGLYALLRTALALTCSVIFTAVLLRVAKRRIGGVTGDVLGAVSVIAESVALVGFLIPLA